MPNGKKKTQSAPDIFALMRADPFPPPRPFTEADGDLMEGEGELFMTLCMVWADCFALPAIFAQKRRALGDPAAAPIDHECGCDVANNSFEPQCEKRRAGCRFAKPPQPPSTFFNGVPYTPPKEPWPRGRYAILQARAAFLAYADAPAAGRRAMERRILRALSSERASAFIETLADQTDAARAGRSTTSPPSARNRR